MIVTMAFNANTLTSPVFTPRAGNGMGFNVSLSGVFSATVGLYRNLPGDSPGVYRLVSSYTAPTETAVVEFENGATYVMQSTAYTSGTATGRLGQGV